MTTPLGRTGRITRASLILSGVLAGVFVLFCISVAIWGSWWRFANMPTAEEWQAFFGASALVALWFAWYQIRQVDQSNNALIASNELARRVNLEAVRPRVQVSLEATRQIRRDRGSPVEGSMFIAVRNIGVSPASNVKLGVSPPFTSLEAFFKAGMMSDHFADVNSFFNNEVRFHTLQPGSTYIWFLGRVPELFVDGSGKPRRWEVTAEYSGTASIEPFRDTFILDLDIEKRIELPVDPLVRIGKDIEVVGANLKEIMRAIPRELNLSDDSLTRWHRRQRLSILSGGEVKRSALRQQRKRRH